MKHYPAQRRLGQRPGAYVDEDAAPPGRPLVRIACMRAEIAQQVPDIAHIRPGRIGSIQLRDGWDQLQHALKKPELVRRGCRKAIVAQHWRESRAHPAPGQ